MGRPSLVSWTKNPAHAGFLFEFTELTRPGTVPGFDPKHFPVHGR